MSIRNENIAVRDNPWPGTVCLRVTRVCNARCPFCLAPPDGVSVPLASIRIWIDRLFAEGTRSIHLCGGEPTVRTDLPLILRHCRSLGLGTKLTTNGLVISEELLTALAECGTRVKVSLHGPRHLHDRMLGVSGYHRIVPNIDRMLSRGIAVSIQSIVTAQNLAGLIDIIAFCRAHQINKITFVPFIPRGYGRDTDSLFALSEAQKELFGRWVSYLKAGGEFDLRLLDLENKEYFVLETNGTLMIQRETENSDAFIELMETEAP